MLPDRVRHQAEEIAQDTTSGAFPLAQRVLDAYRLLEGQPTSSEAAQELHRTFTETQPWMVAVRNASLLGKELVRQGRPEEVAKLQERFREARSKVARQASGFLRDAEIVLTISNSSDVFEALTARGVSEKLRVLVSESRPLLEGVRLTADLRRAGVEATLIADAAGPTLVASADLVLSGADSLLRRNVLVNKIGTLALALACRENNVPFRPLLEAFKVELVGEEIVWKEEARDPGELSLDVPALNFYFEEIAGRFFDEAITDAGVKPPEHLVAQFRTLEDLSSFYLG